MRKTHWLGAGLSSVPGIRRLACNGLELVLWNRTLEKAESALAGLNCNATAEKLDWDKLSNAVSQDDVVVSMLPANMHLQVANICLKKQAHFVSSSYISPEMRKLSAKTEELGLCFVNECGLDPGLDHLLAHALMQEYRSSSCFAKTNAHSFRSYCGGFPKIPNEFKYKFSWSPLGVLRALTSQARWISDGKSKTTAKPWLSLELYKARLPDGEETFQAYPNRDSLPFMPEYGFREDWNVVEFVRGTLRLNGWSNAWSEIFELVEKSDTETGQQALVEKSEQLWSEFRYENGEPDRVVLSVELEVAKEGKTVWHQVYCLDECGNEQGSAMARLVSQPVSIAVESVLDGTISAGVSAAPADISTVKSWLDTMTNLGESFKRIKVI